MVISYHVKWAAIEIRAKFGYGPNYSQALFFSYRIVRFRFSECTTGEGDDVLIEASLSLSENGTKADATGIRVYFCGSAWVEMAQDWRRRQETTQLRECGIAIC